MKKKIVLNLSAVDYGGAGKFSVDFNNLLRGKGFSSFLIVKDSKKAGQNVIHYKPQKFEKIKERIERKLAKKKMSTVNFDYDHYFYDKYQTYTTVSAKQILSLIPQKPDVIFIHWVTDFVNSAVIGELHKLTQAKIYWLMIDNAPITGGCHYPWECIGFQADCTNCPAIIEEENKNLAKANLAFKKKYLPDDVSIIAFSESDYQRAIRSSVFKNVIKWIGVVDETKFTVADRAESKTYFGIQPEQKVVFCGASSLKEKRKGMQLLLDVINRYQDEDVLFMMAGNLVPSITLPNLKLLGLLDEATLIKAYQAADVFVSPSLEDSGPMMVNQALMCGTPVVAFDIGVAKDLVKNNVTGYKASIGDVKSLKSNIFKVLTLTEYEYDSMSLRCRSMSVSTYGNRLFWENINNLLTQSEQNLFCG